MDVPRGPSVVFLGAPVDILLLMKGVLVTNNVPELVGNGSAPEKTSPLNVSESVVRRLDESVCHDEARDGGATSLERRGHGGDSPVKCRRRGRWW